MIHGLVIDVKGEELIAHATARASHHRRRADECETQPEAALEPMTPESLERKVRQHRERVEALMFFAKHLVPDEVYRVSEIDLRAADLLPGRSPLGDWLW